jgi:MFS family permease
MDELNTPKIARNSRIAISAVFMVFGTLIGAWFPHIPDVQKQIGVDYAQMGSALLCSGFGAVFTMPLLGRVIHRFGSKGVTLVGGLGACTLVPLLLSQHTLIGLCINLVTVGVCYGLLDVGMNSHSMQVQHLHTKPIISGIHGWFSFGGIIGGVTAAICVKLSISPLEHMVGISVFLALVMIASYKYMLPSYVDKGSEGPKLAIPKGILLVLGLFVVCAFVSEGGMLDWCASFVRGSLHAAPQYGGIVTATCSASMTLGRFAGDSLLARFGNRNVVLAGGALGVVGFLGASCSHTVVLAIALLSLAGFGISNMVPVFFKEAGNVPGVSTSTGVAAVTTCGYSGFLIGPPLIGHVAHSASLGVAMGGLSLLSLVVLIGSPFVLHKDVGQLAPKL